MRKQQQQQQPQENMSASTLPSEFVAANIRGRVRGATNHAKNRFLGTSDTDVTHSSIESSTYGTSIIRNNDSVISTQYRSDDYLMNNSSFNNNITSNVTIPLNDALPTTGSTSNNESPTYRITPVGYTMMILIVVVFVLSICVTCYKLYRRRLLRIQFEQGYTPRRKATKLRIQRRYETIEHWIITKRVLLHDDFCYKVVNNFSHHKQPQPQQEPYDETNGDVETTLDEHKCTKHNKKSNQQLPAEECNQDCDGSLDVEQQIPGHGKAETKNMSRKTTSFDESIVDATVSLTNVDTGTTLDDVSSDDVKSLAVDESFITSSTDDENSRRTATKIRQSNDMDRKGVNSACTDDQKRLEHTTRIDLPCETNNTDIEEEYEGCDDDKSKGIKVHECHRENEEEETECPVCMSPLQVDDVVSWSANTVCSHVYHHECIKEWLLRHTECCLCKQIMLPVDEKRGKTAKQEALQELSARYAAAASTSYYCVYEGLVRIPKTVRCTRRELKQLENKIFNGTVPPTDLILLRGRRQDPVVNVTTPRPETAPNGQHEVNILDMVVQNGNLSNDTISNSSIATTMQRQGGSHHTRHQLLPGQSYTGYDTEVPSSPIMDTSADQLQQDEPYEAIEAAIPTSNSTPGTPTRRGSTVGTLIQSSPSSSSSVASLPAVRNIELTPSSRTTGSRSYHSPDMSTSPSRIRIRNSPSQYNTYVSPARSQRSNESLDDDEECGTSSSYAAMTLPCLEDEKKKVNGRNSSIFHCSTYSGRAQNSNARGLVVRKRADEEESSYSGGSSSSSNDNELILASNHLERSNVIGDNRCRIIENNENSQGDNEEGVEVRVTVSLPIYEE